MKFLDNGAEHVMVDFQVDMDDRERTILFEYARDTMTEEEFEGLMVNWALVRILGEEIERMSSKLTENKE